MASEGFMASQLIPNGICDQSRSVFFLTNGMGDHSRMDTVRRNIRALLQQRGLTQNQMAVDSGAGQSWVNRYMNGVIQKPNQEKIAQIAAYFRVPIQDLLTADLMAIDGSAASQPVGLQRQMIASTVTLVRYVQEMALEPIPEEKVQDLIDRATEEVVENWPNGFASDKDMASAGRGVIARLRATK